MQRSVSIWVYMLRLRSGRLYVGIAADLLRRLAQHRLNAHADTTARDTPVCLAHVERYFTYKEAARRERQIKGWTRQKKEALAADDSERLRRLARSSETRARDDETPRRLPPDPFPLDEAPATRPDDHAEAPSRPDARRGLGSLAMFERMDHVGIAVESLEAAKRLYGEAFGLRLLFEEEVPTEKVRVAAYDGGGVRIELLESTDPTGPIGRHLAKFGPGIHHVCYRVDDVQATLDSLKAAGVRLIDERPRPGAGGCRVAFVHPKGAGGVLVEISQPPAGGHAHGSAHAS